MARPGPVGGLSFCFVCPLIYVSIPLKKEEVPVAEVDLDAAGKIIRRGADGTHPASLDPRCRRRGRSEWSTLGQPHAGSGSRGKGDLLAPFHEPDRSRRS